MRMGRRRLSIRASIGARGVGVCPCPGRSFGLSLPLTCNPLAAVKYTHTDKTQVIFLPSPFFSLFFFFSANALAVPRYLHGDLLCLRVDVQKARVLVKLNNVATRETKSAPRMPRSNDLGGGNTAERRGGRCEGAKELLRW